MTTEMPTTDVELQQLGPQPVLSITATWMIAALGEAQDDMMRALAGFIQQGGAQPVGPPFVRYHSFENGITDLEVGVPVTEPVTGEGRIVGGALPGGPALTTWHLGAHDLLGDAYKRIGAGPNVPGREPRGAVWEVYDWIEPSHYNGMGGWPDPSAWRTQLVQPISES